MMGAFRVLGDVFGRRCSVTETHETHTLGTAKVWIPLRRCDDCGGSLLPFVVDFGMIWGPFWSQKGVILGVDLRVFRSTDFRLDL